MLIHSHSHPKFKVMTAILQFHLLNKPPTRFLTQDMPRSLHCQLSTPTRGGSLNTTIPKLVHHLRTGAYTSLSLNRLADSCPATTAHELSLMPEALTVQSSGQHCQLLPSEQGWTDFQSCGQSEVLRQYLNAQLQSCQSRYRSERNEVSQMGS